MEKEEKLEETNRTDERQEKSIKIKLILIAAFVLLSILVVVGIFIIKGNSSIDSKITSAVKDYLKEYTFASWDVADVTDIVITNTKVEQLEDKKQFSIYGTFRIKDNYNKIFSASFKGTYDIVNKDGKEIYYSNQIKSNTLITYPQQGLTINTKKYQQQVEQAINEFIKPIDSGDLIGP